MCVVPKSNGNGVHVIESVNNPVHFIWKESLISQRHIWLLHKLYLLFQTSHISLNGNRDSVSATLTQDVISTGINNLHTLK